jgi:predicted nucleotidyltransferase
MNTPAPTITLPLDPARLACRCSSHHVSCLWLFGSVLRSEFHPESDIDVLVEFEPRAHIGPLALARLRWELSKLFARDVDLVPVRGLKPAIRDEVLGTRELLYAA